MARLHQLDKKILEAAKVVSRQIAPAIEKIETITEYNQRKVLEAFTENRISESHFAETTGYGYDDRGRDALDRVFADITGAEDGLVRHNFVSGTHAITVALFGVLRPGDRMLSVTGKPYDTLMGVLGYEKPAPGSLREFGIAYEQLDLLPDGRVNMDLLRETLQKNRYKMVYIQRSRGYTLRPSLFIEDIENIAHLVKSISSDTIVMVDNCYGEFVEQTEPTQNLADLMAGSLIKNPGGGIARTGGYIAGRKDLVELCAARLTAPGVGREVGATLGMNRELFMGLFHAPHVTGEALKTSVFAAALLSCFGYEVSPSYDENRTDIIESVVLGSPKKLTAFCQGIQMGSPIDSGAIPEAADMPGYDAKVIMAAGAFTMGASIEISADGPMKPPYVAWLQGGLNYHSGKWAVLSAVQRLWDTESGNI